ncbi:MAG: c-type cytochrome [Myxococcota bacterium]
MAEHTTRIQHLSSAAGWLLTPVVALGIAMGLSSGSACRVAPAATPAHGDMLFSNYCAPCHGSDAAGKPEIAAPAIAGLPQWYVERQLRNFRHGVRGTHFDDIEGMRMRPMSRTLETETDVTAVAMYVSALAPQPGESTVQGNAEAGKVTFTTVCAACHMPTGAGMDPSPEILAGPIETQRTMGPTLLVQNDWYLYKQIGKFQAGIRGVDAKHDAGVQMRTQLLQTLEAKAKEPAAAGQSAEQVLDPLRSDVVAYIQTLRK